jgi:ubiquinone/menaquinone biosynthesis C-methylase UbiE
MMSYPLRKQGEVLRENLDLKGARVLEVGCGDGALVRLMTREGATVTGIEIDEGKLDRARAAEAAGEERYRVGRGEALPFEAGSFDLIVFFNSLHHVPVSLQDLALSEAARVLKPGGRLCVVEPLAEGALFELMRPVDDETEVRAAAYQALHRASEKGPFVEEKEYRYDSPYAYASFETLKERSLAVDESRREAFEAREAELRVHFERAAERVDGEYRFSHPNRMNLLRRD